MVALAVSAMTPAFGENIVAVPGTPRAAGFLSESSGNAIGTGYSMVTPAEPTAYFDMLIAAWVAAQRKLSLWSVPYDSEPPRSAKKRYG
jgi:hypothetical protein